MSRAPNGSSIGSVIFSDEAPSHFFGIFVLYLHTYNQIYGAKIEKAKNQVSMAEIMRKKQLEANNTIYTPYKLHMNRHSKLYQSALKYDFGKSKTITNESKGKH